MADKQRIPTTPIPLPGEYNEVTERFESAKVTLTQAFLNAIGNACETVLVDRASRIEASRDWWPLAMCWSLDNEVGAIADLVCQPTSTDEISAIVALCSQHQVPVTTAGGRSGVLGGSIPVHGGVVIDMCGYNGIEHVDTQSLTATVRSGTFGNDFEAELQDSYQLTCGHWPQSMALSTVGGWVACSGAGQFSTRYGKIEDMVQGLEIVLPTGELISIGHQPRHANGADLANLFVGSEGTLGIICSVTLKLHPLPTYQRKGAWMFDSFERGLDACRTILQRGATPAVLRLYDEIESDRNYKTGNHGCALIVLDEGDPLLIDATFGIVEQCCSDAESQNSALVDQWLSKRNNTEQLQELIAGNIVVDTMEITAPWSKLDAIFSKTLTAIRAIDGVLMASCHQSHAYSDGACLYFTFAGKPEPDKRTSFYLDVWNAGTDAVLTEGGSLSHHHGVGLNRGRFMNQALGGSFATLQAIKDAIDPNGIMNPAKMGLASPFGNISEFE